MIKRAVFAGLMVVLLLSACVSVTSESAAEPLTITFYKRGYVEGGADITSVTNAKAVEAFEKRNPNISVNIVGIPWDNEGDAQLQAALESGQDINVFSVTPAELIKVVKAGQVSSIEPFLTEEDKADFYPNGLQAASVNGKVYAWPIWVVAYSVFVNTELFEERGVDLPTLENPWTWDEFVDKAKHLTYQKSNGTQVYGFNAVSPWWAMQHYPFFYLDGGRIFTPDGKRFAQNRPDAVSGLQKIADLYQTHQVIPPSLETISQADAQAQFKEGNIAMFMSMPAFIRELEAEDFPVTVVPLPVGDLGKLITTGAFGMYGVYNVDDPEILKASHEFAKYITGSQVAKDVPGYQLAPGLRRSNTGFSTSPNRETIAQLVEFGVYEAPVPISVELSEHYSQKLKDIVMGEKTPQEAMDELAPVFQQELDEIWK